MKHLIIALLLAALPCTADAAEFRGCYERIYDAKHLAENPGQRVDSIQVQLGMESGSGSTGGEEDQDIISLSFQGKKALYFGRVSCTDRGENLQCRVDEDGGSFRIEPTGRGMKVTFLSAIKINEEGTFDKFAKIEPRFDNGVFALRKVSSQHCDKLFGRRKVK